MPRAAADLHGWTVEKRALAREAVAWERLRLGPLVAMRWVVATVPSRVVITDVASRRDAA